MENLTSTDHPIERWSQRSGPDMKRVPTSYWRGNQSGNLQEINFMHTSSKASMEEETRDHSLPTTLSRLARIEYSRR
jgi:hypothetical protein